MALAAPCAVHAQTPPADAGERVEITAPRSPFEFPYARAYEMASKVRTRSAGAAELAAKVVDRQPAASVLRVSLQYGDTVAPIATAPDNSFAVPIDPTALEQHASFNANRPRQDMTVQVYVRPRVDRPDALVRADIGRLVDAGRAAEAVLFPWYARMMLDPIRGIRLCSLQPDARFAWRDATGTATPLEAHAADDVYSRPAHCVEMTPAADARERAMALVLPPDTTFAYVWTRS